jgi:hypothetical protein
MHTAPINTSHSWKILVILTVKSDAAKEIKRIAGEKGVELIIGNTVN